MKFSSISLLSALLLANIGNPCQANLKPQNTSKGPIFSMQSSSSSSSAVSAGSSGGTGTSGPTGPTGPTGPIPTANFLRTSQFTPNGTGRVVGPTTFGSPIFLDFNQASVPDTSQGTNIVHSTLSNVTLQVGAYLVYFTCNTANTEDNSATNDYPGALATQWTARMQFYLNGVPTGNQCEVEIRGGAINLTDFIIVTVPNSILQVALVDDGLVFDDSGYTLSILQVSN